ncbi:MAG: 50S ribosomal protein L23 [Oscillospiraceae bacterium]|nr:50S ribosomal protein L23 [Oscillospiraceae bacterium]
MNTYDVIRRPLVTEQSMSETDIMKYAFEVDVSSNKIEIRKAVEEIFGVKVMSVNTINMYGKQKRQGVHMGRRPKWKKAVVRLAPESKPIEFFEGMV